MFFIKSIPSGKHKRDENCIPLVNIDTGVELMVSNNWLKAHKDEVFGYVFMRLSESVLVSRVKTPIQLFQEFLKSYGYLISLSGTRRGRLAVLALNNNLDYTTFKRYFTLAQPSSSHSYSFYGDEEIKVQDNNPNLILIDTKDSLTFCKQFMYMLQYEAPLWYHEWCNSTISGNERVIYG